MHHVHFSARDAHLHLQHECVDHPGDGDFNIQIDFGEHDSVPMGPEERGDWWYAHSRLGISVFVAMAWASDLPMEGHCFFSTVSEPSSLYAIARLLHLITSRCPAGKYRRLVLFCDVGPHFRSSLMLYFILYRLVNVLKVFSCTRIVFFPPGHGKGICDAQIGLVKKMVRIVAKQKEIHSCNDYCGAVTARTW